MTNKDPEQDGGAAKPQGEAGQGGAERDPLTSFDPAAPAEAKRPGNGSEHTVRRPGGAGEGEAPDAAAPAGAAQDAAPQDELDELELSRREAAQLTDRLLRTQAEFDNYKKRLHKEHADALRYALTPLVTEVAAILDNLERAVEHARKEQGEAVGALLAGMEMVLKQMQEALTRFGVQRIEAVGKPFDPTLHEAIQIVETQTGPDNHVVDEYQAGYLLHDRVVRPARVSVSKRAAEQAADAAPAESRS